MLEGFSVSEIQSHNKPLQALIRIYKILMITLSLGIMFLSVWDIFFTLQERTIHLINQFDLLIMFIFIMDLLVNLKLSKDKKNFIKMSIIEVIIITPFAVFLKVPVFFKKSNGMGNQAVYMAHHPKLKGFISTILSQKFILRSIAFVMKPSVIRATKFFNLSRNYFNKVKKD